MITWNGCLPILKRPSSRHHVRNGRPMHHDLELHKVGKDYQFQCESCEMVFPVTLPLTVVEIQQIQYAHKAENGIYE